MRAVLAVVLVACAAEDEPVGPGPGDASYMLRRLGGEWEPMAAPGCGASLKLPDDVPFELAYLPSSDVRSIAIVRAGPGDLVVTGDDCDSLVRLDITIQNRLTSLAHIRTRWGFGEGGEAPYVYSTVGIQDVIAIPYEDSSSYVPAFALIERGIDVRDGVVLDFARANALERRTVTIEGAASTHVTSYVRTAGGTSAEIGGTWFLPETALLAGDEQTIAVTTDDLRSSVIQRVTEQVFTVRMAPLLESASCMLIDGIPTASATTSGTWNELSFSIREHPNTEPSPASFSFSATRGWPDPTFDASSLLTIPGWERGWRAAGGPWGSPTCQVTLCEQRVDGRACASESPPISFR